MKLKEPKEWEKNILMFINEKKEENKFDYIILSIFSKNGKHIAGNEKSKLSYVIRYSKYSTYGIYDFDDYYNKKGEIKTKQDENTEYNWIISFNQLKWKRNNDNDYTDENSRFVLKLYPMNKKIKIYNSISIFDSKPKLTQELEVNTKESYFNISGLSENEEYYFTVFTFSEKNHEIISYNNEYNKIMRSEKNLEINDDESFENNYDEEKEIEINVDENIEKKNLEVKISGFESGKYGLLYVEIIDDEIYKYKSIQHSDHNIVVIPSEKCIGKKIKVKIELKDGKTDYYFSIKFVDIIEITPGENVFFEMYEEKINILINTDEKDKKQVNIFIQSPNGDFDVLGLGSETSFIKSELFGAKSASFYSTKSNII